MQYTKIALITILFFALTACGHSRAIMGANSSNYLKAESIPPLKIPPGLSSSKFQAHYPVSAKTYPAGAEKVSLTPPGL